LEIIVANDGSTDTTDKLYLLNSPAGTWTSASGAWEVVLEFIPQTDLEAADGWGTTIDRITHFAE
jgi:hypothetical protein